MQQQVTSGYDVTAPELRIALEKRQAADTALEKHDQWMKERYGHRGVPPGSPERRESDRLEAIAWEAKRKEHDGLE